MPPAAACMPATGCPPTLTTSTVAAGKPRIGTIATGSAVPAAACISTPVITTLVGMPCAWARPIGPRPLSARLFSRFPQTPRAMRVSTSLVYRSMSSPFLLRRTEALRREDAKRHEDDQHDRLCRDERRLVLLGCQRLQ